MHIYLTAFIKAAPGKEAALKDFLLNMVSESKKEAACLRYDLQEEVGQPGSFIFHELWESEEGLTAHNSTPHIKAFAAEAPNLLGAPVQIIKGHLVTK
ncbi:quinol monooxygenase YgiN [Chitinophaga skermanii]|uniref:Quinol monooxygenase YgiN n=1 Tax=Chitinophaga skermanii TaxID=331697 RepID=A0A327QUE5_9BACT|nr:putative quinol monooxygenase [Chitinophaga skermanii]RAJ05367.1 quinol monooxygenase YgiN [Chitinophaga skermanii]